MISLRRIVFVAAIAAAVGILAAFAVSSQAEHDDAFEAVATVGLGRIVATDELDAERESMLARITRQTIDEIITDSGATEVEFIAPDSRSYIAVVARAESPAPARIAADRIASEIATREDDATRIPPEAVTAPLLDARDALAPDVDELQAQIDSEIAEEARLTVPLSGFLTDEERSLLEGELAEVQARLSDLRSQRDQLVDEQNALLNDAYRAEFSIVEFEPAYVIAASSVRDTAANTLRSAVVTALIAAATAIGGLALTTPGKPA